MKYILLQIVFVVCASSIYSNTFFVSGKVVDGNTGLPIYNANIFIANSTFGVSSNTNGEFAFSFMKNGVSNLVVKCVGYQALVKNLTDYKDRANLLIKLKPEPYVINAVNVSGSDPNRKFRLSMFSKLFLGQSKNGMSCEILNPSALHLSGNLKKNWSFGNWHLDVKTDSLIIIDNKKLGYKVKYNLQYFKATNNQVAFFGYPFFEECINESRNPDKISERRKHAYGGSKMHFFRSLYSKSLETEGFEVFWVNVSKKDSNIQTDYGLLESVAFTNNKGRVLKQTWSKLNLYEFLTMDSITGSMELSYNRPFEIWYTANDEESRYRTLKQFHDGIIKFNTAQVSIAKLKNSNVRFYRDGTYENPDELLTMGYWSYLQTGDLLPSNYVE